MAVRSTADPLFVLALDVLPEFLEYGKNIDFNVIIQSYISSENTYAFVDGLENGVRGDINSALKEERRCDDGHSVCGCTLEQGIVDSLHVYKIFQTNLIFSRKFAVASHANNQL